MQLSKTFVAFVIKVWFKAAVTVPFVLLWRVNAPVIPALTMESASWWFKHAMTWLALYRGCPWCWFWFNSCCCCFCWSNSWPCCCWFSCCCCSCFCWSNSWPCCCWFSCCCCSCCCCCCSRYCWTNWLVNCGCCICCCPAALDVINKNRFKAAPSIMQVIPKTKSLRIILILLVMRF
jgi:hypothetical protein